MNNADKLLKIGMELGRIQTQFEDLKEENKKLKDKVLELSNHLSLYSSEETMLKKIEKLEEENKTLKELNVCVGCENNPDYKSRNNKAIDYIHNTYFYSIRSNGKTLFKEYLENIEKILKGEE